MSRLPHEGQLLLLKAALGRGNAAAAAWADWERRFRLDRPDQGSYRLLPLVYRNLANQGLNGPEWSRLKGIYRRAWSENQILFHRVRPMIDELRSQGVPLLFMKGAMLASLVYPDTGSRPMHDVDILVPAGRALKVFAQLESRGWKPRHFRPRNLSESFLRFRHAMDFEAPGGGSIDLHWHVLHLACHEGADAFFQRDRETFDFGGSQAETFDATGHLLQICTHGIVWSPVPPVRWIADAVLLLRRGCPIDWQRLVRASIELDIAIYVSPALGYLEAQFGAGVPSWVIEELRRAPSNAAVRAEFAKECEPEVPRSAWQDLLAFYARWRRSLGGAVPLLRSGQFVRHLQFTFELESAWQLPAQFLRSARHRLGSSPGTQTYE